MLESTRSNWFHLQPFLSVLLKMVLMVVATVLRCGSIDVRIIGFSLVVYV